MSTTVPNRSGRLKEWGCPARQEPLREYLGCISIAQKEDCIRRAVRLPGHRSTRWVLPALLGQPCGEQHKLYLSLTAWLTDHKVLVEQHEQWLCTLPPGV